MGKRMLGCLVLAICMLGLGGCMFGNVDEMYALPKSSEAYVNLQAKINQEKGSAEYIAPLSGENRQTIQLVDVDGDGVQEAVAFFRDTTSENPLNTRNTRSIPGLKGWAARLSPSTTWTWGEAAAWTSW